MGKPIRLALALLALVVLAFGGAVAVGVLQADCDRPPKDCAEVYAPGGLMKAVGGWLGRAGPQAALPQARYSLASMGSAEVEIGPSEDDVRTLKLVLRQGTAQLSFRNRVHHPRMPLEDQADPTTLPRETARPEDSRRLGFAVTTEGGTLTIRCSTGPCIVEPDAGDAAPSER
jgi:hypothetical protein